MTMPARGPAAGPAVRRIGLPLAAALAVVAPHGGAVQAQSVAQSVAPSVALRDSIPIGSNGLCEAQIQSPRPGEGLFDRRYIVVCRDAAAAVGTLQVFGTGSPSAAMAALAGPGAQCRTGEGNALPTGLSGGMVQVCTAEAGGLERLVVAGQRGNRVFAATGLAVYADALRLGLASLVSDRLVDGTVEVPLTQAGDAQGFARAQAEAISAEIALDEAYRRSNAGNFAEAAEFFALSADTLSGSNATEAQLNAALQQSNLGNFIEARGLFAAAEPAAMVDPLLARLARNFQAIDAINRNSPGEALQLLDTPLPALSDSIEATLQLQIDNALATRLSAEQGNSISGVGSELTLLERLQLLDGQAEFLRGSALRLTGQATAAEAMLLAAQSNVAAVRDGRVVSVLWLRAQILAERAELAEARGDVASAEALHGEAVAMLAGVYPGSPALVSARGQLAGLYARTGREAEAVAVYRQLVDETEGRSAASLRQLFAPYFRILAARGNDPVAAADMFAASQLLLRPGLAQTQAVLARELSGGSDEAAQLFRQSINLTRAIEVLRADLAQAQNRAALNAEGAAAQVAALSAELSLLSQRQLEVQQQLAAFPRYRAVSDDRLALADLQQTLAAGEGYLKLLMLDDAAYAVYVETGSATAYRLSATPAEIGRMVDMLRDSIAIEEGGQTITYPFEMATARSLYTTLLGPVSDRVAQISHLIFEPDGAMLRLPANLLVMDDASVTRYAERTADPEADPYDYRGTAWLGRAVQVTTAVSPSSFRDVRTARRSDARSEYLGLGQNLPVVEGVSQSTGTRSGIAGERCSWSPLTWGNPISAAELRSASTTLGGSAAGVTLLTDGDFTDTRLKAMDDLDEYRILHFATHGLVTSPQPDCPPSPALLTSFGDSDSDGLLTFAEIYDLRLDADLVILSACNTASVGGLAASREAGVTTGGDFALDGLVRAFVGAGGRTVVASHWPVPDDYNATDRLISGFFDAGSGQTTTEALRLSQLELMDDADTSHPFYWSAFAVVGDGAIPLRR
ncbi:CHAT domain-containing protein [Altererythrobacter sp. KTW20L]|uniref:CHAT domain-containing protein n=1 Tax=Altererythrobacter sp. KTW20L TaxID=2942210 RepID=UPI0020C16B92|nr:CHAT domain-containing protein [Altererythrobacter sp. KTW20L]MCL6251503.1 CHAT domain-containing protein [Altererythrobacter sp. KTW20L]